MPMYKLLIVDNEPRVRYGLRHYLNWSAYGIEVAGEAEDGESALQEADRLKPDIVFTDVRLRQLDGIELSRRLRECYPRIKIVFVSEHTVADYLKSALQLNAVDYIFKPVNLRELRQVVRRITVELAEQDKQLQVARDMQVKLRESLPLLRERFLYALLGQRLSPGLMQERIAFLELNLPVSADYAVLVITVDDYAETLASRNERDRQLLIYAAVNVCQELMDLDMGGGYALEVRSGELACILRLESKGHSEERLLALAEAIRYNLERWLAVTVTIGVGERSKGLGHISHSYAQAREAAERKWYLGKNRIITMNSPDPSEEQVFRVDHTRIERLTVLMKAGDAERLQGELDCMFGQLAKSWRSGADYIRNLSLQLALLADQLLLELGIQGTYAQESPVWEILGRQETIEELHRTLEQLLSERCALIWERRNGKSGNLVERVQAIINARYAENITVTDIGRDVFLTPTYVCLLYKQETGRTVNDYLTQVRMERAKELLRNPRNKLYDICYAVGYADPSYFTKLFKKIAGVTPSVYRDSIN
jgi:two-component system, response regulator YesN